VYVESDFLREYNLDLSEALPRMSWRRFLVLLRGLSPQSATVAASSSRAQFGKGGKVNEVTSTKAAQQVFDALFRPG
jgi:hypothetical protein